jgi:hypothetical protein
MESHIDGNIDVLETFPLPPKEEKPATPVEPLPEVVSEVVVKPSETPLVPVLDPLPKDNVSETPPTPVELVSTPTKAPTNDVSSPRGNRTLLWVSLGFLGLLIAFGYSAYYFYNLGQRGVSTPTIPAAPQFLLLNSPL